MSAPRTISRAATLRTLIGLLAVTGMRIGEALRLDRGDIDHEHDLLVVRDSKFGKSRELALYPSTITALRRYLRRRDRPVPAEPTAAVFTSATGTRLTYCTAHLAFKRIVDHAGLQPRSAGCRRTCAETAFAPACRMEYGRSVRSGKQCLRGLWLLVATAAMLALTLAGSAAAATKTVSFDDLTATTRVSNQYQASSGVTFPSGGGGLQPYVTSAPLQAHSPSNVAVYNCIGLAGCVEDFSIPRFRGVLSTSASSVSAYVGYFANFSTMNTVKVRLLAYNADGMLQAQSPFVTVTEGAPLTQQVTAAAPAATIDYFEIVADSIGDGSGGKPVAFDDLVIVTPDGPGAPNITLNPGQTVANVLAGTSVSLPVELNRHNASDGDVSFTVSGLPAGMSASFSPNPVSGAGTTTELTLTAAVDAPSSDAYSEITVTATPSLGAGPTPRTITKQVRVRTAFTMTRAGPPEVDLAPCSVKVPLGFVRDFGFAGPVSLSVTGMAAGVLASFDPSQVTFPNGAGAETVNLVVTGPATGVPTPPTELTIRAGAPGLADRTATVTVRGTCPQQYDARVTSLEITQGTQSEVLPQRYLDHPASPIPYAEIPNTARLRRDGPTVVRVYANLVFGPTGGVPNVPLTLSGAYRDRFGQLKAHPDSPLSPISGLRRLKLGPEQATAAEAASETAAYTFVLPQDWTHAALTIGANLLPSLGGGSPVVAPCARAACVQNDNMGLKSIPFVTARQVTVKPLQLTVNGVAQPDPVWNVFNWTRMMLPLPLHVMPYQATIDITDVANDQTRCIAAAPPGTAGSDHRKACSNAANEGAAARVSDWTCDQGSSDRTWNIGVNTGVARGKKSSHWCFGDFHIEEDAVVERNRPMTSVSHEFGHLLGRVHADTQCRGNSDGQEGEAWLPDGRGLLQSVGLAIGGRTGQSGGVYATLAPPKEWFDYMSYCAETRELPLPLVNGNSWISVRNWNRILGSFDLASAASTSHVEHHAAAQGVPPARARAAAGPAVAALHVRGFASGGEASIVTVSPGRSPPQPTSNSAYHLVGLGAGGTPVVDVAMLQADVHTDGSPPSLTLGGVIPAAGVTSVAIVKTGTTFATRARSTNAPTVAMRGTPAFRRGTATVRWRARDADGGRLLATIDYSADGGRSFETVWTGQSHGIARFPARHLSRSARARVRVTVNDGFREASVDSPRFRSPGAPPVVTILSSARRLKQPNDAPLVLSGQAFDDQARALTGRRLTWRAGKRVLGTGERISATGLPAGRHRVDLLARDGAGRTGRASVVVVLTAARPLFLTVSAPRSVKRAAGSMRLKLVSSLPATLAVRAAGLRTQRFAVGRKARTITVRIPRGAKPLNLRLSLTAGTRSSVRSLLVTRG